MDNIETKLRKRWNKDSRSRREPSTASTRTQSNYSKCKPASRITEEESNRDSIFISDQEANYKETGRAYRNFSSNANANKRSTLDKAFDKAADNTRSSTSSRNNRYSGIFFGRNTQHENDTMYGRISQAPVMELTALEIMDQADKIKAMGKERNFNLQKRRKYVWIFVWVFIECFFIFLFGSMSKYIWKSTWLIIILSVLEIELDQPLNILNLNMMASIQFKQSQLNCNTSQPHLNTGNQSSCTDYIYTNIQPNCWDTYMEIIEFEPPIAAEVKEILDQRYNILTNLYIIL